MNNRILWLILVLALPGTVCAGKFEPYEIQADISYYSDEYSTTDGRSELGEEKNFEEVWQNYNYYEAVFDSLARMVIFKAYKQGSVEFSETYYYEDSDKPVKKVIETSDGTMTVVTF